jgi:hypothetical protein
MPTNLLLPQYQPEGNGRVRGRVRDTVAWRQKFLPKSSNVTEENEVAGDINVQNLTYFYQK